MKIVHISDTHGAHGSLLENRLLEIYEAEKPDVIVHSGDFMMKSMDWESANDFITWYLKLPFKHKLLIPGNHDCFIEMLSKNDYVRKQLIPEEIHLLIDSSVVIDGVKFYGSPFTPEFHNWCFMLDHDKQQTHWKNIPDDTDVLITHGPAYGVLDQTGMEHNPGHLGCVFLLKRIQELDIKAHLFGHIHGGYGREDVNGYLALNSSILNERYKMTNSPQVFSL